MVMSMLKSAKASIQHQEQNAPKSVYDQKLTGVIKKLSNLELVWFMIFLGIYWTKWTFLKIVMLQLFSEFEAIMWIPLDCVAVDRWKNIPIFENKNASRIYLFENWKGVARKKATFIH